MLNFKKNIPSILAAVAAFATIVSQAALADHGRGGHDRGHNNNNNWNTGYRSNNFNNGYNNGYYANGYGNNGYGNRHRTVQHEIRHDLHKL